MLNFLEDDNYWVNCEFQNYADTFFSKWINAPKTWMNFSQHQFFNR